VTIEEIKRLKDRAVRAIEIVLDQFSSETGLLADDINVRAHVITVFGGSTSYRYEVTIKGTI
jgi:hypothetical protein